MDNTLILGSLPVLMVFLLLVSHLTVLLQGGILLPVDSLRDLASSLPICPWVLLVSRCHLSSVPVPRECRLLRPPQNSLLVTRSLANLPLLLPPRLLPLQWNLSLLWLKLFTV
jgi:hypothetical protein